MSVGGSGYAPTEVCEYFWTVNSEAVVFQGTGHWKGKYMQYVLLLSDAMLCQCLLLTAAS